MSPITRARLEKTVVYHEGVSNYYKGLLGLKEDDPLPEDDNPVNPAAPGTAGNTVTEATGNGNNPASPPEPYPPMPPVETPAEEVPSGGTPEPRAVVELTDAQKAEAKLRRDNLQLAKTHAEVVRQLRAVLSREMVEPAILQAQRDQMIMRDPAFGMRPQAGRFH